MKQVQESFNVDSEFLYQSLMASVSDYTYLWKIQEDIFKVSQNMVNDFDLKGTGAKDFIIEWMSKIHERDIAHVKKVYEEYLVKEDTCFNIEYQVRNADNHFIWISSKGFVKRDEITKKPLLVMCVMRNLEQSGKIDTVTGLLKYKNCKEKFQYFEKQMQNYKGTMLLVGIDDFNNINTLNNHSFGDMVLRRTAQDILKILPENANVYRFEGDQFLIVGENISTRKMKTIYARINEEIGSIRQLDNQLYRFTISAALISFPKDAKTWTDLEKGISVALKKAKENGKNRCVVFTKEMLEERLYEQTVNYFLAESIRQDFVGFHVVYQPVCIASTLKVKGSEALLRFETPDKKIINPSEFIPLLENSQLIIPVGLWVLEQAIITCKEWIKYIPDFVMNVNVSYIQLRDAKFCKKVEALIKKHNLPVNNLTLELTESYFMSDDIIINASLDGLKELHLQLAMDDFGTGYSSLGQLTKFKVDIVKIDRFFVQSLHKSKYNYDFIESVIRLCHNAEMSVCVEGVETREEQEIICMLNADFVQGYYVSKPMKKDEFYNYFIETPYDNERLAVSLDAKKRQKQLINDKSVLNGMMNGSPLAMILWDRDFEVVACNDETIKLFGVRNSDECIKHFHKFSLEYQADGSNSHDKLREILKGTFSKGKSQFTWLHRNLEGEEIPCEVTTIRIPYLDDFIVASYTKDLREQLRVEQRERKINIQLKALLDAYPLCVNLWDIDHNNVMCNQAAVKLFELNNEQDYLDKFHLLSVATQANGKASSEEAFKYVNLALETGRQQFKWMHCTLNGELIPAEITLVRIDGLGKDGGDLVAGYTRDLREQIIIEEKNEKFAQQSKALLDATPLCLNLWDKDHNNVMCNREAVKLFELNNEQEYLDRFSDLSPILQPNGQLSSEAATEKIGEAIKNGRVQFEWTHQKLNGELIPAKITLVRIEGLGKDGGDLVAGYTYDLREQLDLEKKERIVARRMRSVIDATPLACILMNLNKEIFDCNELAMKMFGVASKQNIINNFKQFMPLHQPDGSFSLVKMNERLNDVISNHRSVFEWIYESSSYEKIPSEVTLVRTEIEEGEDIIIAYSRDLRELKKTLDTNERLEKMVRYDSLTGCMTREYFMNNVASILTEAKLTDLISMSFFDLDNFKKVNDTYGHKAGDIILREVVSKVNSFLPEDGLLGRFGGDEFMVFLKNMNEEEVKGLLKKVVQDVAEMEIVVDNTIIKASISVGTTLWKGKDRDCEVLLRRADSALYKAKKKGRGCAVIQ